MNLRERRICPRRYYNGKQTADRLCILKDKIGINNNDIIAFGDGLNDVVMIENVGFGVAMKNALDEVKNKANDITLDDNNNDGVVNYLKSILK